MSKPVSVNVTVGGKELVIETGRMASQAAGAVTVRMEETVLFSAVTCTRAPREGIDYFPLQVEYREKFYAAGKFPGGFFKREARPSEKEILTARLTDRPIRPLFPKSYRNDVQINSMLLSADGENDPDMLSIVAASAALHVSEIPFLGPIAGVRVGRANGQFYVNPTHTERNVSDIDLVYASTHDLMIMLEGSASEVQERDLVQAMRFGHAECVRIIEAQIELRRRLGLPDKVVAETAGDERLIEAARNLLGTTLSDALRVAAKLERERRVTEIGADLKARLLERFPEMSGEQFRSMFDAIEIETVRSNVLDRDSRIDGRKADELRPISAEIGVLPRTHGSALFQRGETQSLGTVTLGTKSDIQSLDAIAGGAEEKRFMVHYNMPPYSTGEVGRLGSTGRREIGHGALAERTLLEVMPEDYPYTVRLVSDIMGSNGSSSMASVCVGSLSLMDAGVPIRKAVAGISVGLFSSPKKDVLVVDILGAEDHCGDMDFKVAGTRDGVTGFQVDLKIRGLRWDLVEGAFQKAHGARLQILDIMDKAISAPRAELSPYAPRIQVVKIPADKIGALIGPGGKTIRKITDLTGAQIDIEEDGTVNIFATTKESMEMAVREVSAVTAEVEEGNLYEGVVTGVKEFGAFVEVLPGRDGLVHISELADMRVDRVEDICKVGDRMWVKCIGVDDRGRVRLSRKAAMREKDKQ